MYYLSMKENSLTLHQEEQIALLLKMIQEQSVLFPTQEPLVVKIPFDTLKESSINKAEARHFIQYLNQNIGEVNPESIWINILNGTITKIGDEIVSQTKEDINPVSGVYLEDDEDSLILEIYNWKLFLKKTETLLNIGIYKSNLKSYYINNEIIIGKRKLKIYPNTNYSYFCEIMFKPKPKIPVSYGDIWETIKGEKDEYTKMGGREKKSISNLVANLNRKLKIKGINQSLFRQQEPAVFRNY